MFRDTIINPVTGRKNAVKGWHIDRDALYKDLLAGKLTAKSLSWSLLSDEGSYQAMQASEHGDSANNNYALAIMEQALDWAIGLKVLGFILDCARAHKRTKDFDVLITGKGDVFIRLQSGALL